MHDQHIAFHFLDPRELPPSCHAFHDFAKWVMAFASSFHKEEIVLPRELCVLSVFATNKRIA